MGLVESLSRPGGNVTGFSDTHADLSGEYVQFAIDVGKPQGTVNYLWHTGWRMGNIGFRSASEQPNRSVSNFDQGGISDIAEANDVLAAMKTDEIEHQASASTGLTVQPELACFSCCGRMSPLLAAPVAEVQVFPRAARFSFP